MSTSSLPKLPPQAVGAAGAGSGKSDPSGDSSLTSTDAPTATGASVSFPMPRGKLTAQEERLYTAFTQNIGHRFTYDELAQLAHTRTEDPKPLVAVLVCRIRRKLPKGLIIEPWWKRGFVMERVNG